MNARKGFTLAELMVTLSIIALLTVIVVPSMTGVATTARIVLCQNHLKRIGEATQTWSASVATDTQGEAQPRSLSALASAGWPALVMRYASFDCLKCPEGTKLQEGTPVEEQLVIRTSPTGPTVIPLVSMMEGGSYKVLKLSNTQWESGIAESARQEPVPYVPDGNPNVYWWGYDDGAFGSGDYDFQDCAVKVTKNGDGTATIYVRTETAGKPEVWDPQLTKCYASWDQTNVHHNSSAPCVTFTIGVGGASHYGMNGAHLDMQKGGKIQAIDYLRTTAYSTDDWNEGQWDLDEDDRPDFLRHRGRLNVLYTDGTVRLKWREDVDPVDVETERELWQP
ncbi:MAG: prepilin-type N-terminal cleavage/methylation domain-containing protein [Phycisphaerae bacterium]